MNGIQIIYLKVPLQNRHAATNGYADTKLLLQGGNLIESLRITGTIITHLGDSEQGNDAVRLRFVNENLLKRDGSNCMRGDLSLGGRRIREMAKSKNRPRWC